MRRVLLLGSLLALIAALFALWAFRYERMPGVNTWKLTDLLDGLPPIPGVERTGLPDQPGLRLRMGPEGEPLAIRLAIPQVPAVEGLQLRFRMNAYGLKPGTETWQDGRFMVEWHHPENGGALEENPVGSILEDIQGELDDVVVQPDRGPAVPTLRLEHMGRSGEFELAELEITAVRERAVCKTGRWCLALGWVVWIGAFAHSWPGISRWRALGAAVIWVLLASHFAIPGPWKRQRAMVPEFQLGGEISRPSAGLSAGGGSEKQALQPVRTSGPLPALGKIPEQGDFALRVKLALSMARPVLHAFMLFAPALAFFWLVGRQPALCLSGFLAISIELAQIAFGYGFDLFDVGDLATDAAGIALAWWVYAKISTRMRAARSTATLGKVVG